MAPKGSVGTLYYVTKTTPKGKTYQNAFLKKEDAQEWARRWVSKGATDVQIHCGYPSNAPSLNIYSGKFKKVRF